MLRKTLLILACTCLVILTQGCGTIQDTWEAFFPPRCCCWDVETLIAGYSVQARPIQYSVHGNGRRTILFLGAIHGNEPASAVLAEQLRLYLCDNRSVLKGRTVVLLPVANPDGLAAGTRFNTNGVDLNRNFLAANRQNTARFGLAELSEPEAVTIKTLIDEYEPDVIISIHQPLNCIDYDGPAEDLAKVMAEHCDLPVRKLGAMPGSLGSYSGLVLGIPIITFELPGEVGQISRDELWGRYSQALLAAIAYPAR